MWICQKKSKRNEKRWKGGFRKNPMTTNEVKIKSQYKASTTRRAKLADRVN